MCIRDSYKTGKPNQITVLDDINLQVKKGEVVGLIAPSGAGKSTLLHVAGLLDLPNEGQVMINGVDYTNLPDIKRTQVRRQDIGLFINFTIYCLNLLR